MYLVGHQSLLLPRRENQDSSNSSPRNSSVMDGGGVVVHPHTFVLCVCSAHADAGAAASHAGVGNWGLVPIQEPADGCTDAEEGAAASSPGRTTPAAGQEDESVDPFFQGKLAPGRARWEDVWIAVRMSDVDLVRTLIERKLNSRVYGCRVIG
nr:unnamed protein product [Digitaria exilis]